MAPKLVKDWDNFSLELLCVVLMTGTAQKRMKEGLFFGFRLLKIGLARCQSETVSVLLFLHNVNHSSLPVVEHIAERGSG